MTILKNRVKEYTSTTGTGAITPGGAVAKYRSFATAGVVTGNTFSILIELPSGPWEISTATVQANGSLTRVLEDSSTGALINLTGEAGSTVSLIAAASVLGGAILPGVTAPQLTAGVAASATDGLISIQGGSSLVLQTMLNLLTYITRNPLHRPGLPISGTLTLDSSHQGLVLVVTTATTIIPPNPLSNAGGDGFKCEILNKTGAVITFAANGAVNLNIGAGGATTTSVIGTTLVYGDATQVTVVPPPSAGPTLTFASISNTTPGATSTVTYNFSGGANSGFTAGLGGTAVTFASGPTPNPTGSNASLAGTITFTMTNPAAGTYSLTAATTGTYAATAPAVSITMVAAPSLTFTSISSTVPGASATAIWTYVNGQPTAAALLLDGAAATLTGGPTISTPTSGSGATATGTVTYILTVPAAGTHTLVASTSGTYAATATGHSWVTAAASDVTPTFPAKIHFAFNMPPSTIANNNGLALAFWPEINSAGGFSTTADGSNEPNSPLGSGTWQLGISRSATTAPTHIFNSVGNPGGDGTFLTHCSLAGNGLYNPDGGGYYYSGTFYLWYVFTDSTSGTVYRQVYPTAITVT